ncbi:MAG: hypothetical protein QW587_04935 [Candidatus Bathyarchaeia archaeon]
MIELPVPGIPGTEQEWFWFLLAFTLSRGFSKQLDQSFQGTAWYGRRSLFWRQVLKRSMDATHHWWAGWALWLYSDFFAALLATWGIQVPATTIKWMGSGIFYDDIPDFVRYVKMARKAWKYIKDALQQSA